MPRVHPGCLLTSGMAPLGKLLLPLHRTGLGRRRAQVLGPLLAVRVGARVRVEGLGTLRIQPGSTFLSPLLVVWVTSGVAIERLGDRVGHRGLA